MSIQNSSKTKKPFVSYTKYALSDTEIKRALEVCNTTEKETILRLGVYLGIRRDDMAHILISNIDFTNHRLAFKEKKKGNKIHTVPMIPDLEVCLKKHINAGKKRDYLFERPSGSTLYRRFQDIIKDAGLQRSDRTNIPFHALRGTSYKFWQRKGMAVEQIASLMDDTVKTAMEHYGAPTLVEIESTMNRTTI